MPLRDLLALADDKLADDFNRKAPDPSKARERVVKMIGTARNQFESTSPTKGRKRFRIQNSIVAFTPGFTIGGKETLYIPSERFADFLTTLEATVSAGELDAEIAAEGQTSGGGGTATPKRGGRGPKGPWSEARRAAFEAAKAAKGKGAPA